MSAVVRDATEADAAAVAAIYNRYIVDTTATFEVAPISADVAWGRTAAVLALGLPYLVAEADGVVTGFAYASALRDRAAYAFTREVTVYVHSEAVGRGVGTSLYAELLPRLEAAHCRLLVATIALPNPGSVAIHERFGFRQTGTLPDAGRKLGRWVDVGYWTRVLRGPQEPDRY